MSLDAHLAVLQQRHSALDNEIAAAVGKPSTSDTDIRDMKRRKLQLKEEIERLRASKQ